MTLVATHGGGTIIGYVEVGKPPVTDRLEDSARAGLSPGQMPWWKLNALNVYPDHRGRGVAIDLLSRAVDELPARLLGLYGVVDINDSDAIRWCRRRGFYLDSPMKLPATRSGGTGAVIWTDDESEAFFRGTRQMIVAHLQAAQTVEEEDAHAAHEARRRRPYSNEFTFRDATEVDRRLADAVAGCVHVSLGPRPTIVMTRDGNQRQLCDGCARVHLDKLSRIEAPTARCDVCGRSDHNRVEVAAADRGHVRLVARLCHECRR